MAASFSLQQSQKSINNRAHDSEYAGISPAPQEVVSVKERKREAMDMCRAQARTNLCAMYPRLSLSLSVFV